MDEKQLEKLTKVLKDKINEGIENLKNIKIGTSEYQDMVSAILNTSDITNTINQQNEKQNTTESLINQKYEDLE